MNVKDKKKQQELQDIERKIRSEKIILDTTRERIKELEVIREEITGQKWGVQ